MSPTTSRVLVGSASTLGDLPEFDGAAISRVEAQTGVSLVPHLSLIRAEVAERMELVKAADPDPRIRGVREIGWTGDYRLWGRDYHAAMATSDGAKLYRRWRRWLGRMRRKRQEVRDEIIRSRVRQQFARERSRRPAREPLLTGEQVPRQRPRERRSSSTRRSTRAGPARPGDDPDPDDHDVRPLALAAGSATA